jgi:hypothetical protein
MSALNQQLVGCDASTPEARKNVRCGEPLEEAVSECRQALTKHECRALTDLLRQLGKGRSSCHQIVVAVNETTKSREIIDRLKGKLEKLQAGITENGTFEQYLLLNSAIQIAESIRYLPVADGVKELYADDFRFFAHVEPQNRWMFCASEYRFVEMCKVASLRRFPAGQLQWEVAGFARRNLLRVSPADLPRLLHFIGKELRGFRPWFCLHLNGRRKNNLWLLESEQNQAYYRIAKSMALQPTIRGMVIASWLHSPETFKVTPQLGWLNKPFIDCGGLIVDLGKDDPKAGALVGSRLRKELWEKGEFVPRMAAAIWPREAMLRWAAQHSELGEQ